MENMKETVVREEGNCFYRAVLLWNDMSTDGIHVTILKGARESQNSQYLVISCNLWFVCPLEVP